MKPKTRDLLLSLIVSAVPLPAAEAHTFGAHDAGFAEGFVHPMLGADHVLAMIGVGLWAAQLGYSALWRLPLAFIATMAAGALLGRFGNPPFPVDGAVALSVLALGLMLAGRLWLPSAWAAAAVALFALAHGWAHGIEMPQAADPGSYAAGFLLATATLHAAGILLGFASGRFERLPRFGGVAIAATGLMLLVAV